MQIQLMITLGIPPLSSFQDLRRDLPVLPPLALHLVRHLLGRLLLLRRMVEDAAPVLGAGVGALPVFGGGVVHLVEEFEEGGVGDAGRVEGHLQGFGVYIVRKGAAISNLSGLSAKQGEVKGCSCGVIKKYIRPVLPVHTAR